MVRIFALYLCFQITVFAAIPIEGRVLSVSEEGREFHIAITASASDDLPVGHVGSFRVSMGDHEIGYLGRSLQANAVHYNKSWHLEQVFPLSGAGAEAMESVNEAFHEATAAMRRGKFVREGDNIPNFAMIDQDGKFVQAADFRGNAFVLNFIFTRCAAPTMCPASSTRMESMQERARSEGLSNLHFVTITFDPAFDSPGILRTYAQGYGMELENFHLLTGTQQLIDDLLRQFGILTREEDGTINHTMATLLVDADGRVAYRKEGPNWTIDEFLEAARKL
jgi:protein SCO1/2